MMKWGMEKSLCTSQQWKVPHTHTQVACVEPLATQANTQAMRGIIKIAGDFRSFRLSLLQGMRVFESTGPVFNLGCIFASLTKIFYSDAKSNYHGVILTQQRLPHIIYTSTSKAAVNIKNKKRCPY